MVRFNQFCWLQIGIWLGGLAQPAIAQVGITPITQVSSVKDRPRSATTVKEWLTQIVSNQVVQVTNVELKPTADGLEIVLVTQIGERLQGTTSVQGNQLVTTISNAQLQLAEGQSFRRNSPVPSITSVVVTAIEPNSIQIIVTGTNSAPEGEIVSRPDGLTLSVLPALPEEEIVVTAQKRPEPAQNVPISLTVIPRQTLEDTQINALQGISDNAPNFSFFPTNAGGSDFAYYSIRGLNNFNFLVSQDSVGFYRTHLGSPEGVRTVPRQV